ncbi:MAG: superoxide dismutase family protein [Pseudomonadota bacterium]
MSHIHSCFALLLCCFLAGEVKAQNDAETRARVNTGAIRLITGGLEQASNTYNVLARDLAAAVDEPGKLRLLPIMGYGAVRNVEDMLYLQGIDVGMMRSDVLRHLDLVGKHAGATTRLRLLLKLYDEPFHILARRNIRSLNELAGKKVSVGPKGSSADMSNRTLLRLLKLKPKLVNLNLSEAVQQVRQGKLAAVMHTTRRGSRFIRQLKADSVLHLLPVLPTAATKDTYSDARLTSDDYPNLVADGQEVQTMETATVLAVFNWRTDGVRYPQVRRFVDKLFAKQEELSKNGLHPAWRDMDWTAEVKGWKRYPPAKAVLEKLIREGRISLASYGTSPESVLTPIKDYFAKSITQQTGSSVEELTAERREQLFQQFLKWPKNPIEIVVPMRLTDVIGPGKDIGTVTLSNTEIAAGDRQEAGLLIKPNIKGLKSGRYAFHVHQFPKCGPAMKDGKPVKGLAAGSHILLTGTGRFAGVRFGTHLGDLPDLIVDPKGVATAPTIAPRLSLWDVANRALIIHASEDDASDRMACGPVN